VKLPALADVRGAFNIQSKENIDELCAGFEELSGEDNVIKGEFTCIGEQEEPSGAEENGGNGNKDDEGAASALGISSTLVLGLFGLMSVLLGLL
jgi:hypothetical protein